MNLSHLYNVLDCYVYKIDKQVTKIKIWFLFILGGNSALNSWDKESSFGSPLYSTGFNQYDDKSLLDYEKGYRYGTNKDKLDEALENAVLKSELYGDPSDLGVGPYRYYDGIGDGLVRKRRGTRKVR